MVLVLPLALDEPDVDGSLGSEIGRVVIVVVWYDRPLERPMDEVELELELELEA